ncbi:hypothetical protein REC12_00385 [Desulfosporosinus sp. PR]|uniref:hypothetical protein n=1 Tax=Candidatus Desulfosporosinus nitrosoreducens TaxID=3401928 RepID=UPI0027F10185|nr:hypothetical protein [Desulfosporosinus sp. PR]MDQ7092052.1 hypothetical protein [Desulfosporosinus sp. PR]
MIKIFSKKKFLSIRKEIRDGATITETRRKYSIISIYFASPAVGFPAKPDMAQKQRSKISPIFGLFIAFQRRNSHQ